MEFVLFDQLTLQQQRSKIKGRVSRLWESTIPQLKNEIMSLECLLIDEKGNSIQGTIRKYDVQQFKSIISEGSVYIIENFNVIPSRDKYKIIDRKYMIQINKWTNITETMEDVESIPSHCFQFSSFDYIKGKRNNDSCLLDVLGSIATIGPITYTYVGHELTPIRNMEIKDLEDNIFPVTLWDKFALGFNENVIYEKEPTGPVIIIFASMSVRMYKDKLYLSTCSASRFYINLEVPEVTTFRKALDRRQLPIAPIRRIEEAQQVTNSPYEQMLKNRKTVAELLALNLMDVEDTKHTCQAKLVEIDTTYGWWYKACYDCKGAVKDYDGTFWCNQCGKNDQSPVPWYKLNAIVADDTGSANFTIFGKSAQDLIRVPAQQLATAINSNKYILPPAIRNVLGQIFIFQVSLDSRKFNLTMQTFRVTKIFQSPLFAKMKIEKNEEDVIDITKDGAKTSPKEVQTSSEAYLEEAVKESRGKRRVSSSQLKSEQVVKQSKGKKKLRSYIESSESDKEEE